MKKYLFKPILAYSPSVEYSPDEDYLIRQILEAKKPADTDDILQLKNEHRINEKANVLVWNNYYLIQDAEMSVFEKQVTA